MNSQINKTDSKGLKQGPWEKFYPKSTVLEYKGNFKNNLPIGEFTYFYPSTKVKAVIKHSEEGRSVAYFYHENGEIMTYGIYRNYKKDSLWFQFNEAGKIVFTEEYRNDLLNGKKTVYYPPNKETGKVDRIASITHFTDGKADGEYVEYFDFGSPRVKGQFKNGLKSGVWTEYQPTGKPLVMNRFKGGVKHGWCSAYDALGKESNKVYYYYGQPKDGKDLEFIMKQMKEKGINPNE
ncbi:MAG: hypothetical protein KJ941_01120 [Bacteroidetes bacterium]|nr:hypothetical protein [Bacteroidota bacterium]